MRELFLLVSVLLLIGSVSASLPEAGMTGLLHFNWSPGTANFTDEGGKQWSPIGTTPPTINTTSYKFGNGSSFFYGTAAEISVANSANRTWLTNHSIEFWYYPTTVGTHQTLYHQTNGAYQTIDLYYKGDTKTIGVSVADATYGAWPILDNLGASNAVPLGQWSHIEVDWARPYFRIYVNGIQNVSTASKTDAFGVSSNNWSIGRTDLNYLTGNIDEFAEWNITNHLTNFTPPTSEYGYTAPVTNPITASFTPSPNPSTVNQPVTFTDTSTGTPITWNWTIGGVTTNTTQNAAYTFTSAGTYPVNLNVTNATGSFSDVTINQVVNNATGFTPQDIWMEGRYTKTLHITDSSTNAPIPVVTVTDSNGQSYTTTNGTAVFTESFGSVVFYFVSSGYVSKSISYVIDSDSTDTVQMVAAVTANNPSIVYIPQQVRFQLIGTDGMYLSNVFIQATPINFTAPANWTETLLGIAPGVGIRDTTVYGTTGTDGSWVAPMLQSFQYQINLTRSSDINYNFTLYPQVTEYRFIIPVAGYVPIVTPSNIVSYSLQNATINESSNVMFQFINMTYNDGSLNTNKLSFVVYDVNNTLVYSQNYTGAAANAQNFSYVQKCNKGQAYTYGFQANQSAYGWINQSSTIKLTSQIELLANGPAWIGQWVAIVLIVVFGTLFMIYSKPFALIGIPLLTWAFQYIFKLIPGSFLSLIGLGCMLTIGVLVYIRQAENKIQ